MKPPARLGLVAPDTVERACACGQVVPARSVRYRVRRASGDVETATWFEPLSHPGPCGARCEMGWANWKPGELIHRNGGACLQCERMPH